jgi:hypothetical protein
MGKAARLKRERAEAAKPSSGPRPLKLAILIGAGASYGAGGIGPERPPLGKELLGRLRRAFPGSWGSMLTDDELRAFGGDPPFELGMQELWGKRELRAQTLITDMARYFCRFEAIAGRQNCYQALGRVLGKAKLEISCCSLNYDCLLEENLGGRFRHAAELDSAHNTVILKPHGSCNYLSPITRTAKNVRMEGPYTYVMGGDVEVVSRREVLQILDENAPTIPPVFSLYEKDKFTPVNSEALSVVRRLWSEVVPQSDVVLTIGARPVLEDEHVWQPITEAADTPVWFVGFEDDDAYRALRARIGDRLDHVADTFEDALPALADKLGV